MASVWGELKRRNVVKVAVAYAIVGWVLIEVSTTVLPVFEAPDWIAQVFTFFVILGFPLALILSWAYEITPEGIKLERNITAGKSITHVTGRKLDFAIIGALVLALGFVVYNFVLEDGEVATGVLPNSVAVLPFENLSPDPDEAYFATGLHDEILSQLAKLSNLSVISRTSMLRYANSDLSIPEIARELNVGTVMEGSVRYADGRVRITTQLIDAATDEHLWSETYEREFSDIFAIESDIAMNVANALEAEFSLEEQQRIEEIPTDSPEAYALYLRATSIIYEDPSFPGVTLNRSRLESVLLAAIELDSDFALAYSGLARVYATLGEEALTLEYAHKALEFDPDLGLAYSAMASMYRRTGRYDEALDVSEQGVQLSPADPGVLLGYASALVAAGRGEESLRVVDRVMELDPASALSFMDVGLTRWLAGDRDGGLVAMRRCVELMPEASSAYPRIILGMMEITLGDRAEAVAQVQLAERLDLLSVAPHLAYGYRVVGLHDDATRVARTWVVPDEESPQEILAFNYHLGLDEEEEALEALVRLIENPGLFGIPSVLAMTNAFDDPTMDKPEFAALRAELRETVGWN